MRDPSIRFFALLALAGVSAGHAASVSLDGAWTLGYRRQQEGGAWTSIPATVPGDTYAALHAAGVIPDPTVGTNAWGLLGWEQYEWRYVRTFRGVPARPGERLSLIHI